LWAVASALYAPNSSLAFAFVENVGKILLPFLVGITTINSVGQLKILAWVIALSQGYVAWEMNLSYFQGYNRIYYEGFAGLDNNSVAIAMVVGVGLAAFLGYAADRWWQTLIALLAALCMLHAILLSFSRGGLLALLIVSAVSFLLIPKRPKHYLIFVLLLLVGFRLAGDEVVNRFGTIFAEAGQRDPSAQSRLDLWANAWDAMQHRPLFGVGPNHWPLVASEYGWPAGKEAHSLWLQTGAELGFPGLAMLGLFYGLCIVRLWPFTRDSTIAVDPWLSDAARMVIAAITGFAVAAQFVSLWALEIPYYVVLLGAAALKLFTHTSVQQDGTRQPKNHSGSFSGTTS
jgi:O-antigen ligase